MSYKTVRVSYDNWLELMGLKAELGLRELDEAIEIPGRVKKIYHYVYKRYLENLEIGIAHQKPVIEYEKAEAITQKGQIYAMRHLRRI